MKIAADTKYFFDEFEVDSSRRLLRKKGQTVALNPKAFDLLLALLERGGQIVTKNSLLDAVWENQFVEEKNLTVHIAALRNALGETKSENRFIATVPGTGYKFVAKLYTPAATEIVIESQQIQRITIEEEIIEEPLPAFAKRRSGRTFSYFYLAPVFVCILLIGGGYLWKSGQEAKNLATSHNLILKKLTTNGKVSAARISPDGNFFVYSISQEGAMSLWLGQTNGSEPIQLRPPKVGATYQSFHFTEDGSFYFVLTDEKYPRGALFKSPMFGGTAEKLRENIGKITFAPDSKQIAFVRNDQENNKSSLIVSGLNSSVEYELASRPMAQRFSPQSPAWSPNGLVISVGAISDDGTAHEVYTVSIPDGKITRLTNSAWNSIRTMAWQTNGNSLVVVADERTSGGTTWQIFEVSYPEGAVRRLITDLNSYGASLSLSSDGKTLLAIQGQSIGNIWVAPAADLGAAKQITFGSIGELSGWWGLDWTPDGKIIYTKFVDKTRSIWAMEADGSNQKQLIPNGGENYYPSVAADGKYLVFQSNRSGQTAVWRANIDGAEMKQLTDLEVASQPNVSPDGKWIVFVSNLENFGTLYRISIDGGERFKLTENQVSWPRISPDNKSVACAYETEDKTKLALLSIDGGEPFKLFDVPARANFRLGIRWTPDGKGVTYRDWDNGIWLQRIESETRERLQDLPSEKLFGYGWSSDGKRFAFARGTEIRDAILIRNFD